MKNKQKACLPARQGFTPVIMVLIIIALLAAGGIAYYVGKSSNTTPFIPVAQNFPQDNQNGVVNNPVTSTTTTTTTTTTISTTLPTPYISAQSGWPPVIKNLSTAYTCTPGRVGMGVPVTTTEKTINGRIYCIKTENEGTAGSIYNTYNYTTASGNGTKTTNDFTLRYVDCGVYAASSQQNQCQNAQSDFSANLDAIIDSLM